jgi:hypothetical protein
VWPLRKRAFVIVCLWDEPATLDLLLQGLRSGHYTDTPRLSVQDVVEENCILDLNGARTAERCGDAS